MIASTPYRVMPAIQALLTPLNTFLLSLPFMYQLSWFETFYHIFIVWDSEIAGSSPVLACLFSAHLDRFNIVGNLCDREVACSASDRQVSNFELCVWWTVSSHSSHHPQEVLLAQFNIYEYKWGLKTPIVSFYLSCERLLKHLPQIVRRF